MPFYRALVEMDLGSPVKIGEILSDDHLAGRDISILTRYGYVEFVKGDKPKQSEAAAKVTKTQAPVFDTEEATPVVEETGPVKATVTKSGVWFQVFANGKKIFNSRKENEATNFANDFNSKL